MYPKMASSSRVSRATSSSFSSRRASVAVSRTSAAVILFGIGMPKLAQDHLLGGGGGSIGGSEMRATSWPLVAPLTTSTM